MKTRLLKKLRKEAKKKIYIESCFAGVRKPPYYIVHDEFSNLNSREIFTLKGAIIVANDKRRLCIEHKAFKMRMERQRALDNKILDL